MELVDDTTSAVLFLFELGFCAMTVTVVIAVDVLMEDDTNVVSTVVTVVTVEAVDLERISHHPALDMINVNVRGDSARGERDSAHRSSMCTCDGSERVLGRAVRCCRWEVIKNGSQCSIVTSLTARSRET